ncbi:MAG: general secretion pathway protein GspK [Candidatus Omnitrophica bacterium]|nr:general secretion pathway protein GspK [Candidatus Omnitrophota bacterium]
MIFFHNGKGSILILTLWVLTLLSVFVVSVGYSTRQRLRKLQHLENRETLRTVADAGVRQAIYFVNATQGRPFTPHGFSDRPSRGVANFQDVLIGDAMFSVIVLDGSLAPEKSRDSAHSFRYGVVDEERKIHLNQTNSPQILKRLFQLAAGLNEVDAHTIAVSILDWRDEDDFPYDRGAESFYYKSRKPPYIPKNADFNSLEELLLVRGVSPEIYRKVLPYLTLDSSGKININTASRVVLEAVGFSESLTSKIWRYRAGKDTREGTRDDKFFKDLSTVADNISGIYYLTDDERGSLESFIGSGMIIVRSENFSIHSIARFKNRANPTLTIHCVVTLDGRIKRWQEYFNVA